MCRAVLAFVKLIDGAFVVYGFMLCKVCWKLEHHVESLDVGRQKSGIICNTTWISVAITVKIITDRMRVMT